MNNFKSGSGNLDFGDDDDEERDGSPSQDNQEVEAPDTEHDRSETEHGQVATTTDTNTSEESEYPYFVRRNNVGDERETRLEIHLRDEIADQEHEFRQALARELDTDTVSKTDAREFALLAAFQQPELVAELMREEGYGSLY